MKVRFLCNSHRAELTHNGEKANTSWQRNFDTGLLLSTQDRWQEALPYIGCAFETAAILLATEAATPRLAYERYTSAASLLIDAYGRCGQGDQCRQVYWAAIKVLMRELSDYPEQQVCIGEHLELLYRQVQHPGSARRQANLRTAFMHHHRRILTH